jgi:TPR repeat protein
MNWAAKTFVGFLFATSSCFSDSFCRASEALRPTSGANEFYLSSDQIKTLRFAALAGSGQAANRLANYYGFLKNDIAEEMKWATISAENGNHMGCVNLANLARSPMAKDEEVRARAAFWQKRVDDGKCASDE